MSVYAGKLEIQVVEGQDLVKKTHMMDGKADPYVKFSLQSENCRSKTHKNGGKNPVWNDSCSLNVNPGGNVLQVAVYDEENFRGDKLMGEATINLDNCFRVGTQDLWTDLRFENHFAGRIHLILFFKSKVVAAPLPYPTGQPQAYPAQPGYPPQQPGYPPQQPGYPPQQPGYPPQQHGYPPQQPGYPPQQPGYGQAPPGTVPYAAGQPLYGAPPPMPAYGQAPPPMPGYPQPGYGQPQYPPQGQPGYPGYRQ